jgi:putative ABC transport system permease protein
MDDGPRTTRFRFCLWLIRAIGVIVPRRLRADWRQEWEAELRFRESLLAEWDSMNWRGKLALLWHGLGAFADALWLQPRRWEDEMFQDLRFGVRMLVKNPGFTLAAVLSLAIGIGANSALFSVVNGVVLRPLPYSEPEGLVRIWGQKPRAGMDQMPLSAGSVNEWREHAQSFAGVAAYYQTASVFTEGGEPEQVMGASITADLFPLLGLRPELGRVFTQAENKSGDKVVLISHKLWQQRFGGDPAIIGRSITMDHTNHATVVGVMPPGVSFPGQSEFWRPESVTAKGRHDMRMLSVIARLKPGVTVARAAAEIEQLNQQLLRQYPNEYEGWGVTAQPLHDSVVGKVRQSLLVLFGAVGFVLLIACANVANLLLARGAARQKEIAVRAALGAGRLRLLRQMLTESLLLAALGGGFGLLLAYGGARALVALKPSNLPRLDQVGVDGRVLGFTMATSILVGLVFGLIPALQHSRPDLNTALKSGSKLASSAGGNPLRRYGLRGVMVTLQTALAVTLLIGAGLTIKSFVKLRQVELGFDPTNAVMLTIAPPFNRFPKEEQTLDYYQRMVDALKTVPGVNAVAAATTAPTAGAFMRSGILVAGRPKPTNADAQLAFVTITSPDYFRAVGALLRRGRLFTENDNESSPHVALINETMARGIFADADPIGQRISLRGEPDNLFEIVGVVADVKQFAVDQENKAAFYLPMRQRETAFMSLIARSTIAPESLIPALRARIREVDQFTPITRVRTLEQLVSDSVGERRFYMLLLALFAGIALILASIGIYGVLAYSVEQRAREIGIRMALGAQTGQIRRMVVGQGLLLVSSGAAVGVAVAFALTRVMTGLLFGVRPTDPLTFTAIVLGLMGVGLAACYLPARKATRIDPLAALRQE